MRRVRRASAILLWVAVSLVFLSRTAYAAWWPFKPQRFKGNSLIDAGSMGLVSDTRVIAFGDFNGDQFLDVVTLAKDQHTIGVHLWSHEEFLFQRAVTFRHPLRVQNVVPGDFTQDGKLDLLVMANDQQQGTDVLAMSLYLSKQEGGFDLNPTSLPPSTRVQPVAMDANGDLKIDLFGYTPGSGDTYKVWQNKWNASSSSSPSFEIVDANFHGASCRMANPHSNAVVDLDGDCLADVFLVCDDEKTHTKQFQIWLNDKDAGFTLAQTGQLPKGAQAISFADLDRDGTVDMLFASCAYVSPSTGIGSDCTINIAYNRQLPLCSSATAPSVVNGRRVCRPPGALCQRDTSFKFDLNPHSANDAFVSIPLADLFPPSSGDPSPSLLIFDTTFDPPLPVPIRLGDGDLDGFPDVLLVLVVGRGAQKKRTPKLVQNVPCSAGVAGCGGREGKEGARGWRVVRKGVDVFERITDARGVAFLDMDEDGTLDVMVQRTGDQHEGTVLFVQNNFYYDAFFLKAIVLNGACNSGWCSSPNGSSRYHPYGVSYSGATFKYSVIDTDGRRAAAQVAQLPQTAYQALQTPYTFFGLGRTNNYLESLFVGSTKHAPEHFIAMEGVIPNSRVVVIPAPPGAEGGWRRELYLRPGRWIPWVTVTVTVTIILLAGVVGLLHLGEKRADELERRKASHHINFDAL